ncbi:hypothetical protein [Kitasatospora sp. NPDC094015]|uniref:hypothetical protein n=1 Tax=Kitasatospora sp. NPDC094015 TaxID=3155205 RepID=UPI003322E2E3
MSEIVKREADGNPKTVSGWAAGFVGMGAMMMALPVAVAAGGVAALRGRDAEETMEKVMEPVGNAVERFIDAADKHNDTIVKATIGAVITQIGKHYDPHKK